MDKYLLVAKAMAVYASEGVVKALPILTSAGFEFNEALEMLCAFDDPSAYGLINEVTSSIIG